MFDKPKTPADTPAQPAVVPVEPTEADPVSVDAELAEIDAQPGAIYLPGYPTVDGAAQRSPEATKAAEGR